MYLRKLQEKDAVRMYEWMHDSDVVEKLAADFMHMTIDDCYRFIEKSNEDESENLNRAICNDNDEYLGTVSLKNISEYDSNAEYAIVLRRDAMGSGAAAFATQAILSVAFRELGLHKVYLYVKSSNIRAQKFYDKIGFRKEGCFIEHVKDKDGNYDDLIWLAILDRELDDIV